MVRARFFALLDYGRWLKRVGLNKEERGIRMRYYRLGFGEGWRAKK